MKDAAADVSCSLTGGNTFRREMIGYGVIRACNVIKLTIIRYLR